MLTKVILLLLPALAYGSIRVYIKATSPEKGGHIEYLGANVDIVRDADIKTFGLEGNTLIEAVNAYTGEKPDQVFVKSPTILPNGLSQDLFASYNFNQVTRRIIPMTGDIVDYKIEPVDLTSEVTYTKRTLNKPDTYEFDLSDDRVYTVKVRWVKRDKVSKGDDELSYVIDFVIDDSEVVNFSFETLFGVSLTKQTEVKLSKAAELVLEPSQEIETLLTADKVTMEFQVNYTVSLGGDVACYFPKGHKGQQFWGFEVNDVLKAAGMENSVEIRQLLMLEFYANPKLVAHKLNLIESDH